MEFDGAKLTPEQQQAMIDYNTMLHQTFEQNEFGKKLLKMWTEQHIMNPTVIPGEPLEAHGIREGKAQMVRNIIKTIELVNNNYNQENS